ncbi:MAG TPA: FG-GAP-like repeat-containing protein [Pirellulaceae bacterium]|nr:FG-GAP-like repeat-containing protein [Pirellulaceae bacterium]
MFVGIAIIFCALLATVLITKLLKPPSIADAWSAFEQGDFAEAFRLSEQILQIDPDSKKARLIAGNAAQATGEHLVAFHFFRAVGDDGSGESIEALVHCGELTMKFGQLTEAEAFYRRVLKHRPEHLAANQGLLNLLRIEGRNWEALPAIHQMLRQRQYVFEYLALAGPLESVWLSPDRDVPFLEYCARAAPQDLLCLLGLIRSVIMEDSDLDNARQGLLKIVAWNPELMEAQAALGQLLFNSGADRDFLAWHSRLPKSADRHPSIWLTRGRWARSQGQTRAAIRCLWEAITIYPNDRAANLLMANLLAEIGESEQAAFFLQRGEDLRMFDNLLMWGDLQEVETNAQTTEMIEILERLGRLWEARGWSQVLLSTNADSSFAQAAIARLDQRLGPQTPLTLASANPATTMDYSEFPLPNLSSTADLSPGEDSESVVSFDDVARQAKLEFTYFLDKQRLAKLVYTFDFAGGGVAVLDFDQDGWHDLYLTQSCVWPPTDANQTHQNRLFRNHQGQSFKDCTRFAGVGDSGFGNGVAVGDVDGDGFPDLYINNLGRNRLFLNNGDGTFTDRTELSGTAGDDYSLSAVFVDLNRDGLPELYVVNYLDGDAMTRQCQRDGKPIQCSPLKFPGQQDRLYLNLGNGRFREVTDESGILDYEGIGKGMDAIAADLDGVGGPDLFVANDTTANFLFVNKSEPGSRAVRLEERGALSGVAYDDLGRVQSSMGIAARDMNQDGLMDLFVTNFYKERNNLFVQTTQQPSLLFGDRSLAMNLSEPSLLAMGWGIQFLDAELDGDWDLAIANGYLDQNTAGAETGKMQPQFFENQDATRFRELSALQLGPYFASHYFGRAMVRLDWNRDGLEDLCITHMEAPVTLLQNTSQRRGRFAAIQLRGVHSSRDAIGTTVQITAGGKQWTVQRTAGGGFEAASQQQILVGLGDCDSIEQLKVRWPDESEQVFRNVPADRELMLIQGRSAPVLLLPSLETSIQ